MFSFNLGISSNMKMGQKIFVLLFWIKIQIYSWFHKSGIFLEDYQFETKSFVKVENNIQRREEQSLCPKPACGEN